MLIQKWALCVILSVHAHSFDSHVHATAPCFVPVFAQACPTMSCIPLVWPCIMQLHSYTENWVWSTSIRMFVLQCYYCSAHHFTQGWGNFHYHRADHELQELIVCSLQHDKIFNAPSNSHAQYHVLVCNTKCKCSHRLLSRLITHCFGPPGVLLHSYIGTMCVQFLCTRLKSSSQNTLIVA